uniref:Uncharacterized protein n=1 Tax=Colobus angolensis palliatus TaxID=336983 RepID=A0A2K5HGE8_COLAP
MEERHCLTRVPSPRLSSKTCTCFSWSLRDRQVHSLLSSEHQISPDCLRNLVTPPGMLSARGGGHRLPVLHPPRGHILVSAHIPLPGYTVWGPWDPCVRQQRRRLTGPAPLLWGVWGPSSCPPNAYMLKLTEWASCLTASQRMSVMRKCTLTFHPQANLPHTLLGKENKLLAFTVSRALEMPQACLQLLLCTGL